MLYVMRHGQTEWNRLKKLQGQTDIPLNEEGRRMAIEAAERYKDVHFDICYCSPLGRAAETAELLLDGRDIPIRYDDRLKEMNFGICEGVKNYFTENDSPVNVFFQDPANYKGVEKGESIDDLFERTGDFLKDIIPQVKEGKDIVIVAHGALNSSIICQVRGLDKTHFWDEPIDNCRLVQIM